MMTHILLTVLGGVLGVALGWLLGLKSRRTLQAQTEDAQRENFQLTTTLEAQKTIYEERLAAHAQAESRLTQTFENLSHQALQQTTATFFDVAKSTFDKLHALSQQELTHRHTALGEMLHPFRERLQAMDVKLGEIEQSRVAAYTSLHHQVKDMMAAQERLHSETSSLSKALRLPGMKGRWGEIQLRRLVELAGMLPHCDFSEQVHGEDASGQRYRPDMVIHMPGGKQVVVDSKVPLKSYMEALEAPNDEAKNMALKAYTKTLRLHVKELAGKGYWQHFTGTAEFVVLFLPSDAFLSVALQADPQLMEDAFASQVIMATPATFMALLQSMAFGWQQASMTEKVQEIRGLGVGLYQKLSDMLTEFDKLGRHLRLSVGSFNTTLDVLNSKVMPTANSLGDAIGKEGHTLTPLEKVLKVPHHTQGTVTEA